MTSTGTADDDVAPVDVRLVVARYGSEVVGGAEVLARSLAQRLAAAGRRVEVWTSCALDEATWANVLTPGTTADGPVQVRRYPASRRRHPGRFRQLSRGFFRLPPRLRPEALWIALQGPFLPHLTADLASGPPPALATVFVGYLYHPTVAGLPRTSGVRLLLPTAHDELPLRLRSVARAVAAADGLWYATEEERTLVESIHPVVRRRPWAVGNLGVELEVDADPARARGRLGLDGPYLVYGGRRARGKGVEELLVAYAVLRRRGGDMALVLAGEAAEGVSAAPGVVLAGHLDRATWWDVLAGSTAVVVPSRLESLSLLALEAWTVGRPVLANRASPVLRGQVERSGGGLLYGGPEEFADAALRLCADPALGAALGRAGRSYVAREYRWEAVLARFERLVAEARRRSPATAVSEPASSPPAPVEAGAPRTPTPGRPW